MTWATRRKLYKEEEQRRADTRRQAVQLFGESLGRAYIEYISGNNQLHDANLTLFVEALAQALEGGPEDRRKALNALLYAIEAKTNRADTMTVDRIRCTK